MEDNKNNQQAQNQNTDQSGANNTGNNQSQNTQQQSQQNQNTQQNNQSTGGTGAQGKMFTQEDVNRMMTAEKNQGRANAYREMGIDLNDPNAQNMLNMFKAFMTSMQTPEQQAQNQSAQQQIKIAEAETRAKKAEAKAKAMQLGLLSQYVDDAVVIIMSKLDDKTDVKTIVGELKTKYPVWFNADNTQQNNNSGAGGNNQNQQNQNQQNNKTGQNGTGSSVGNAGNKGGQNNAATGIGARLAASRKASGKKSSFWD